MIEINKYNSSFMWKKYSIVCLIYDWNLGLKLNSKILQDIKAYGGIKTEFPYPIIEDESRKLVTQLGMLDPQELDSAGIPVSARSVFIIDQNKKMRLSILYPASTGRNFEYEFCF